MIRPRLLTPAVGLVGRHLPTAGTGFRPRPEGPLPDPQHQSSGGPVMVRAMLHRVAKKAICAPTNIATLLPEDSPSGLIRRPRPRSLGPTRPGRSSPVPAILGLCNAVSTARLIESRSKPRIDQRSANPTPLAQWRMTASKLGCEPCGPRNPGKSMGRARCASRRRSGSRRIRCTGGAPAAAFCLWPTAGATPGDAPPAAQSRHCGASRLHR